MARLTIVCALAALTAVIVLVGVADASASVVRPVRDCAELRTDYDVPGAATQVTVAERVDADPAYCKVEGFVEPAVRFQLKLPLDTYSGRYLQYGCHGLCGTIFDPAFQPCGVEHGENLAVAATDDGHEGNAPPGVPPDVAPFLRITDGTWAAGNRAARADYAYRAPHVVSRAAKRIIAAFYGAPPARSYFDGCSTGGREGLLLAQRYPHDFDGIVAGAPAHNMGPLMGVYFTWLAKTNNGPDGAPIITLDKLPALHDAVIAACDRLDGLVDGQIDDPRACRFDPAAIRCPPGTDQPACLTPAQVASARRLYEGPRDARGRRLYPGWASRGSERAWAGSVIPIPGQGDGLAPLPDNYLRYVGYPLGTPHSSLPDFAFTAQELHRLTPEGVKGNAMSLDLREFRRSGGKLILWHGWDDQSIPAVGTLDYSQRLWQRNGGLRRTQAWARAFMVPTLYHCGLNGGYRLSRFNPFPELVDWVERGRAPERVIASGTSPAGTPRTRPVFPYPARAEYDGSGSIDDASNFVPARPRVPPRDAIDWVGSYLHRIPGPVAR